MYFLLWVSVENGQKTDLGTYAKPVIIFMFDSFSYLNTRKGPGNICAGVSDEVWGS